MAFAYLGVIAMPALFGVISQYITIALFQLYILTITLIMLIMSEKMNRLMRNQKKDLELTEKSN